MSHFNRFPLLEYQPLPCINTLTAKGWLTRTSIVYFKGFVKCNEAYIESVGGNGGCPNGIYLHTHMHMFNLLTVRFETVILFGEKWEVSYWNKNLLEKVSNFTKKVGEMQNCFFFIEMSQMIWKFGYLVGMANKGRLLISSSKVYQTIFFVPKFFDKCMKLVIEEKKSLKVQWKMWKNQFTYDSKMMCKLAFCMAWYWSNVGDIKSDLFNQPPKKPFLNLK